ncbi:MULTISPECIES: ABC-F family ATP-binding cassette domain-containing protein [unclassified Sphingomonas]|jgi:ATP-binding cassette subfamily F protein uup|uniref:ABC-F family ATP-binding cassette domain-containing protein n=1 Tax=unclassified Sphingomonas TaxID=196159 RepID=UPI0004DEEFE6|nr:MULTISPECIES: ABC-F family ATP-binding cassette domain-containing protein [unclassified Sphingomonas]MBD8471671.1 ABC-F family ATP-binding cassette domain-containing protein [Sphingomonas sp. CFBP 8765]MDY1009857.1 ABC-F family ATP-binding cassette domain-containing protein [Sphingomonas sp. CFBP9019]
MAAPILAFEGLGLVQGSGWLFRNLDIHIGPRDRLALIGRNGAGKTTLLKLLGGSIEGDEGRRTIVPGTRVVILEQEPDLRGFATLRDYVMGGDDAPVSYEADSIADQLGIDLSREAASASGGERRRAAIVRALGQDPDVLLLDEPTNHLDIGAIEWIEDWLKRFRGAFVVISHDRTFLTRLTKQTLWLDRGAIRRAEIGFGGFEAWTEQVYAEEQRQAEKLDARLKLEEHWLLRGVTGRRKRNQGRLTKLHEMRAERASMIGPQGSANLVTSSDDTKSKVVIDAKHVTKAYGDRTIIGDLTLRVTRGDRIGIVGRNGAGKSTLLKLLTGEIEPDGGTIKLAKTLDAVVIDQQRSLMAPEKTVREVVADGGDWIDVLGVRKHIHGYLKEFLFDPNMVDAKIGSLSGGERSRLLLAREFAKPSNLLVLDEPTNDLDLETLDLLQEVIGDYDGTVLIVSHDRDFLDRTVTITLGLDGSGTVDVVAGGYEDWEKRRATQTSGKRASKKVAATAPPAPAPRAKLTYKDQRDYELLPKRIEALDAQIASDAAKLAAPNLYMRDNATFARLTAAIEAARAEKEAAELRWLELAEQVGE